MSTSAFTGGEAMAARLKEIIEKAGNPGVLRVGFLEDATYPDGTKVATVAAIQNYGAPAAGIPPRPYFTNMVQAKREGWGPALGKVLVASDYDVGQAFGLMGEGISGQLKTAIINTDAPLLSPITLMLRKMKSEDQSLVVTGKTVAEAAARVAAGEEVGDVNTKPLDETGHMLHSVSYDVQK